MFLLYIFTALFNSSKIKPMAITKKLFRTDKNADATRKAKPSGYRYRDTSKNKHNYKRPTAEEIKKFEAGDERMRQIIYKETRPERSDVSQTKHLKKGGNVTFTFSKDTDKWFDKFAEFAHENKGHETIIDLIKISEKEATRSNLEKFLKLIKGCECPEPEIKKAILSQLNKILDGKYIGEFKLSFGGKKGTHSKVSAGSEFFSMFFQAANYDEKYFAKGGNIDSDVDQLASGYKQAILFTNSGESEDSIDSDLGIYDFDKKSDAIITKMAKQYIEDNKAAIEKSGLSYEQVGMDVWYTQASHGVGFFDRGISDELVEKLEKGAKKFGDLSHNVFSQDGKVYIEGMKFDDIESEWDITLEGADGFEIGEQVFATSEDKAMDKAEKLHKGSKARGVVRLTDEEGKKIEYSKGGNVTFTFSKDTDKWFDKFAEFAHENKGHETIIDLIKISEKEATRSNLEKFLKLIKGCECPEPEIKKAILSQLNKILDGKYIGEFKLSFGGKKGTHSKVSAGSEFFSMFFQAANYDEKYFAKGGKVKTKSITVFSFDDLDKDAQEIAIETERERRYAEETDYGTWAVDDDYLFEPKHDELTKLFGDDFYENKLNASKKYKDTPLIQNNRKDVYFDTDRNRHIDGHKAIEITSDKYFLEWLGLSDELMDKTHYVIDATKDRYPDTFIEFEPEDSDYEFTKEEQSVLDDATQKFANHMSSVLKNIESSIDYNYSDESIRQSLSEDEGAEYDEAGNKAIFSKGGNINYRTGSLPAKMSFKEKLSEIDRRLGYETDDYEDTRTNIEGEFDNEKIDEGFTIKEVEGLAKIVHSLRKKGVKGTDVWEDNKVQDYITNLVSKYKKMRKGGAVEHKYELGDKYREDFDYDGMFSMGTKARVDWGVTKLEKLATSYRDVNYHDSLRVLVKAIDELKNGNKENAEVKLKEFNSISLNELTGTYAKGGSVNSEFSADFISSQLGRKLDSWKDFSVKIKGNEYQKIPFKNFYRLVN